MHPGSRLRENKESEIQPAWERGGNPLGARQCYSAGYR